MKKVLLFLFAALPMIGWSQDSVEVTKMWKQRHFKKTIPAGDYSGIAWLGGDLYAIADDKAKEDGFFVFRLTLDSIKGKIVAAENLGYRSSGLPNRDMEGIAFRPSDNHIYISGEKDNEVMEYTMEGARTGRRLAMPSVMQTATHNKGLESLTYNATTHRFWTTTESTLPCDGEQANSTNRVRNRLRFIAFDDSLNAVGEYFYSMEQPRSKRKAKWYAHGVSSLCALDDGRLLVLEREFYAPKKNIGSWVRNRIFLFDPQTGGKQEFAHWRTRLNLTARSIANFEGMTLGPRLSDGSRTLILVSDSQHQYKDVLKDWFKCIVFKE